MNSAIPKLALVFVVGFYFLLFLLFAAFSVALIVGSFIKPNPDSSEFFLFLLILSIPFGVFCFIIGCGILMHSLVIFNIANKFNGVILFITFVAMVGKIISVPKTEEREYINIGIELGLLILIVIVQVVLNSRVIKDWCGYIEVPTVANPWKS